jgi:hypothetical protein
MMRAQILLSAPCGQDGTQGAGFDALPFLIVDGNLRPPFASGVGRLDAPGDGSSAASYLKLRMKGYSNELATYELARNCYLRRGELRALLALPRRTEGGERQEQESGLYPRREVTSTSRKRTEGLATPSPRSSRRCCSSPGNTSAQGEGAHRLI